MVRTKQAIVIQNWIFLFIPFIWVNFLYILIIRNNFHAGTMWILNFRRIIGHLRFLKIFPYANLTLKNRARTLQYPYFAFLGIQMIFISILCTEIFSTHFTMNRSISIIKMSTSVIKTGSEVYNILLQDVYHNTHDLMSSGIWRRVVLTEMY